MVCAHLAASLRAGNATKHLLSFSFVLAQQGVQKSAHMRGNMFSVTSAQQHGPVQGCVFKGRLAFLWCCDVHTGAATKLVEVSGEALVDFSRLQMGPVVCRGAL